MMELTIRQEKKKQENNVALITAISLVSLLFFSILINTKQVSLLYEGGAQLGSTLLLVIFSIFSICYFKC